MEVVSVYQCRVRHPAPSKASYYPKEFENWNCIVLLDFCQEEVWLCNFFHDIINLTNMNTSYINIPQKSHV